MNTQMENQVRGLLIDFLKDKILLKNSYKHGGKDEYCSDISRWKWY